MGRTRGSLKNAQKAEEIVRETGEEVEDVDTNSDFRVKSPPTKNPRKKSQAFGIPKTAALKAKIDRNAAESPLLRLPREVRARIWKLVIGDRLLHIRTTCAEHGESDDCHCGRSNKERIWTISCCLMLHTEEDLFQRSKIEIEELVTQDEGEHGLYLDAAAFKKLSSCATERRQERHLHLQRTPHSQCRQYLKDIQEGKCNLLEGRALKRHKTKGHVVQVQILQVCRQVYIETNPILWSSNTLSFSTAVDFSRFMSGRVAAQKASITRLILDLSWGDEEVANYKEGQRTTTNGIITSLVGLHTLHLYLQDEVRGRPNFRAIPPVVDVNKEIESWRTQTKVYEARERFANFKRLPLQNVTVLMVDESFFAGPNWSTSVQVWRHAERIKYAESVRDAILDPKGNQKFQQDQASVKAARKAELAKKRLTLPPCDQASSEEECAELNQEDTNCWKILNGKRSSSKPQAQACKSEHVCLVCFKTLKRTREQARQCPKPGKCDGGHFNINFKNTHTPSKSMRISVQPEDTVDTIKTRYISLSGSDPYLPWVVRFHGVALNVKSTVQNVKLEDTDEIEVEVTVVLDKSNRMKAKEPYVDNDDSVEEQD